MAQSVQNVTLSLTLPISCQICLGKVREPVICGNYHVFCSFCIDVWLKKASQCPTCRIPITADNPCRKIIGATNESECNDSQNIKRHMRKTRADLLMREYEDEIEGLLKENEELRNRNSSTESQLKALLDPSTLSASPKNKEIDQNGEQQRIDPHILEEWSNKLRAATDISEKVKVDIDKLKEANKTLRNQNIDLVRENLRLKAEVENRSPQKFGRYTVAALEAKISQYERDLLHLRRALERSDKYIEDLEAQLSSSERKSDAKEASGRPCEEAALLRDVDSAKDQKRIVSMRRSLSAMEEASVRTDLLTAGVEFSTSSGFLLTTSSKTNASGPNRETSDESTPEKSRLGSVTYRPVPSTPSSSFSCLSLESPRLDGGKRPGFKPLSYLRKLSFEDCDSSGLSAMVGNEKFDSPSVGNVISLSGQQHPGMRPQKDLGPWGSRQRDLHFGSLTSTAQDKERAKVDGRGVELVLGRTLKDEADLGTDPEDSMNAAYLDKVSELDSMISECENGRGSRYPPKLASPQSSGFSASLETGLEACSNLVITSRTGSGPNTTQEEQSTEKTTFNSPFSPLDTNADASALPSTSSVGFDLIEMGPSEPGITQETETKTNLSQPPKRKTHSPFNFASPSKMSKFE